MWQAHKLHLFDFHLGNHLIVSAPTGSGKTTILELAIVELLIYVENISYNIDDIKIVYGKMVTASIFI